MYPSLLSLHANKVIQAEEKEEPLTHAYKRPNRLGNEIVNPARRALILTATLLQQLWTALMYVGSCLQVKAGIHEKP